MFFWHTAIEKNTIVWWLQWVFAQQFEKHKKHFLETFICNLRDSGFMRVNTGARFRFRYSKGDRQAVLIADSSAKKMMSRHG